MKIWNTALYSRFSLQLGEGPCWHTDWKCWLVVDIQAKQLIMLDTALIELKRIEVEEGPSAVFPFKDNMLLVVCRKKLIVLDVLTNVRICLVEYELEMEDHRSNDAKIDKHGQLWFGTMQENGLYPTGSLYTFKEQLIRVLDNLKVPNGICWNECYEKMYFIDSFDFNVKEFPVSANTIQSKAGQIIFHEFNEQYVPDGMTIDSEGMLWIAIWGGGCVNRYNPATRELIGQVRVPAPNVTSCAFGGYAMDELLITTASTGLTDIQMLKFPLSGSVFTVKTGYSGTQIPSFRLLS